jgi:leader peptidase (prepilin peptidase) / N-methyltransferase
MVGKATYRSWTSALSAMDVARRGLVTLALVGTMAVGVIGGVARQVLLAGVLHAFAGVLICLAATVDSLTRRLPNPLVGGAALASAAALAAAPTWRSLAAWLGGGSLTVAVMVCARLVGIGGVGAGDIKLAIAVGTSAGALSPANAGIALIVAPTFALLTAGSPHGRPFAFGWSLWAGWFAAKSVEILTVLHVRPPSVWLYHLPCVALAELARRAVGPGGGF